VAGNKSSIPKNEVAKASLIDETAVILE
jgi:hypothetical protein